MTTVSAQATAHSAALLEQVFSDCFAQRFRACLRGGAVEPLYEPATPSQDCATIYYRADYFASALHEVAHWCIAGAVRRQLVDYGYWYEPDTRGAAGQRRFLAVEARPQALEWLFARAAGYPFRLSLDNPDADSVQQAQDRNALATAVYEAALSYQRQGLPARAQQFCTALRTLYPLGLASSAPLAPAASLR